MRKSLYLSYLCIAIIGLWLAPGQSCTPSETPAPEQNPPGGGSTAMTLTSSAFANGGPIPIEYTYDGYTGSPPLAWSGLPAGTQELALIMEDDDLPGFVHWVIYKIPASLAGLDAGVPTDDYPYYPEGALQGPNSGSGSGYLGPDPPSGEIHHYRFTLYALDAPLDVVAGLDAAVLRDAMQGHILATAELVGTYTR